MDADRTQVPIIGADLFCPECSRQLVYILDDGTVALAGKTTMQITGYSYRGDDGEWEPPEDTVLMQALCLRWQCRVKRWKRGEE